MITHLVPTDGRKSFGGKALVIHEDGLVKLQSYTTIVAEYNSEENVLQIHGWYSATTARHINAFLDNLGLPRMNKKELQNGKRINF